MSGHCCKGFQARRSMSIYIIVQYESKGMAAETAYHVQHIYLFIYYNKMLSYRREIALQGTLVLAESGRLELKRQYFTDIVSLASTTVT